MNPNLRKLLFVVAMAVLTWAAYAGAGWQGVALFAGGALMWLLLHFNRTMQVLKRAAERPIGYVESAVMLNARLRPKVTMLHVMAMTRSIGEQLTPTGQQPEVFRWKDNSDSHVTCEFTDGRLVRWALERPASEDATAPDEPVSASPEAAQAPATR